jgi:hypothetical protein
MSIWTFTRLSSLIKNIFEFWQVINSRVNENEIQRFQSVPFFAVVVTLVHFLLVITP